ncbi:MAG: glycosyltransferase family 2 protein [Candidatus Firestonebacteria bacterium]
MISVVVVNANGREIIEECLNSLLNQSLNENVEIIVVDNGSTDLSSEYISEKFPEIKLIKFTEKIGFAKANNEALKVAQGEFIALLNNDAVADKYWLENLHKTIQKYPGVASCTSKILFYNRKNIIDTAGDNFSIFGYGKKRGHNKNKDNYNKLEEVLSASGCASIYRKQILEEVGFFDEDFFGYYEDIDLSLRLQLRGYKCLYVPDAIVYHRLGTTFKIGSDLFIYLVQRNQEYVLIKDIPLALFLIVYPLHLIFVIWTFIIYTLRGKGRIVFNAKKEAFLNSNKMFEKRIVIQQSRKISSFALLKKIMTSVFGNRRL